jgi:hypothetical protein
MKNRMGLCVLLIAVLSPGVKSHSQATRWHIKCPVDTVTTEITTPIPEPWRSTQQVGKLTKVRTGNVAGQSTLECGYWAYGTTVYVLRDFPDGTSACYAEGNGFSCQ